MPLDSPRTVRNTQPGPFVFSQTADSNSYFEFAGKGDPDGRDYQLIPADLLNNVQFRRNVTLGLLQIEEDDTTTDAALAGQKAEWEARRDSQQHMAQSNIDQAADNDILMKECIGPGTRAGEHICGTPISQRADAVRVAPPLCQAHKYLAGQFTMRETDRLVAGRPEVIWVKAQG